MKVALVHDYLRDYGGAERVLEQLHHMFPQAQVYVAFYDADKLGIHNKKFKDWQIHQSWLIKIPFYKKLFSPLRVLAPWFFSSFDLSGYDLIISSSNAYFAKAIHPQNALHICYCHTPPRSLWGYSTQTNWKKNKFIRFFGEIINHFLRIKDVLVSREIKHFIANSKETQKRIYKFYKKNSFVIYPPVETKKGSDYLLSLQGDHKSTQSVDSNIADRNIQKNTKSNDLSRSSYFLYVNRLSFAKHPELAVKACANLSLPLKVVGAGDMLDDLKNIATDQIEFLGAVDDEQLHQLYSQARCLIYPVEDEDFGIVPVEAMSYGVPVIAHASGGPLETVQDTTTGVLFSELNASGLEQAMKRFINNVEHNLDKNKISQWAQNFSKENFQANFLSYLKKC